MPDRFESCLQTTLAFEGGYSDHKRDPGGPTMKGVTQRVYDAYRLSKGRPTQSVRMLSEIEYRDIYRRQYWDTVRADELPVGLDLAMWDYAVNSGPTQAVRSLQRVLGSKVVDGHIGFATLAAIRARDPVGLIKALIEERRRFLKSLSTFSTFGRGWLARCDGVLQRALFDAGHGVPQEIPEIDVADDPDEQSETQGRATPDDREAPWTPVAPITAGSTGSMAYEAATVVSRAGSLEPKALLLAMLSSPTFWMATAGFASAAFVYFWHRRHSAQ